MRDTNLESVCYQVFRSLLSYWHRSCSSSQQRRSKGEIYHPPWAKVGAVTSGEESVWTRSPAGEAGALLITSMRGSLLPRPPCFLRTSWSPVQTHSVHHRRSVPLSLEHNALCLHTGKDDAAWRQFLQVTGQQCVRRLAAARLHRWTNRRNFRSRISLFFSFFFCFSLAAQDQNTEAIRAICCTAHARSDYRDASAARSADAQSGCKKQRPAQTGPRWTGLPFLISFPPPASEQSSFPAWGFVLLCFVLSAMINCAKDFLRRLKMELCGPSLPPEFLNFALLGKMNRSPLYGTALSSFIVSCCWREWLNI